MDAASSFPGCPDYQAKARPLCLRVYDAKRRRDFAAQNLADALRNVELAEFTARAAENAYKAILAEVGE